VLSGRKCSSRETDLIVCSAWSLWSGRNARKSQWNHVAAVHHISTMLEDLILICSSQDRVANRPVRQRACWRKPDHGWVKVNTDATFNAETGQGASGAVLRDDRGAFVAASAEAYSRIPDVVIGRSFGGQEWCETGAELWGAKGLLGDG
jgi:hypothetical protein